MNPLLIGALAGAGLGFLKGTSAKKQEARDRALAAETARWSPWTGMQPTMPQRTDVMGDVISAGTTGMLLGQNYGKALPAPNIETNQPIAFGNNGALMSPNLTQQQQMNAWLMQNS